MKRYASLMAARQGAVVARTKAIGQLKALIVNPPKALRDQLRRGTTDEQLQRCSRLRTVPSHFTEHRATIRAIRGTARRALALEAEAGEYDDRCRGETAQSDGSTCMAPLVRLASPPVPSPLKNHDGRLQAMTRRTAMIAVALGLGIAFGATSAWAGTSFTTYSTTVGAFNGYGYTSYQTKTNANTPADLQSSNVGGSYQVSARTNSPFGTGTWTGYVVDDGTNHSLQNSLASGSNVRAQFRNRPQTPVQVQVDGQWRSN